MKPNRLKRGDTVGVIAPASPPNIESLERGIDFLKELGLKVKVGKSVNQALGYLAGSDQERLADIHEMFLDPGVKAIICACGGYGTGRIASEINYEIIKNNPKIFWGYSDITFLHTAIRQETGLITFHGPMLGSDIGKRETNPLSKQGFQQLFHPTTIVYTEHLSSLETVVEGRASGELVGGNLSLIVSTLGTRFEIDTRGKMLLIEEINEEPRVVDRMLNQLKMAGKLKELNGVIVGDFCDCTPQSSKSLSLEEVLDHYLKEADKPSIKGFMMGHCNPHVAVPFGVQTTLNTADKSLMVESGVR
jgi:muramoyltetrapeptide carboxypeptidase